MSLALYIHIPFCQRKCNYCDFPSYPAAGYNVDAYLQALATEISLFKPQTTDAQVSTLFIGGGTPSILTENQLTSLFDTIHTNFILAPDAEVTIEANPGSITKSKLQVLKQAGVNRLSLGVQSMDRELLKRLGRLHTPEQAVEALKLARQAGFTNLNLDLMNGLPGQSMTLWQATLKAAVALEPEHMSVYGLSIEENTPFGQAWAEGSLELPEDEVRAEMLEWTREFLAKGGYNHYEISNYAVPGKECRHNLVYWHNLPYLGFGAGAATYWQGERRSNASTIEEYLKALEQGQAPIAEREILNLELQMAETMFLGLRLLAGIKRCDFASRFGLEMDEVYGEKIKVLVGKGLLEDKGTIIKLSGQGILLANEVFCEFLP